MGGLVPGLGVGLGLALGGGDWLTNEPAYANLRLKQRTGTLVRALGVGLMFGLIFGMAFGLKEGLQFGLESGLGLLSSGAWLSYTLISCRHAVAGKLPLRLMDFLDDAYRLGLLRTTDPAYQFRHAEFHNHLIRTR